MSTRLQSLGVTLAIAVADLRPSGLTLLKDCCGPSMGRPNSGGCLEDSQRLVIDQTEADADLCQKQMRPNLKQMSRQPGLHGLLRPAGAPAVFHSAEVHSLDAISARFRRAVLLIGFRAAHGILQLVICVIASRQWVCFFVLV